MSKLSKWQSSWKPIMDNCLYSKQECSKNLNAVRAATRARFINTPWGRIDLTQA
jgi:hypothetical protein